MKAKDSQLPNHIVNALMHDDYMYKPQENQYSVTEILDDPNYVYLRRKHANEIEVQPEDNFWLMFGNIVHTFLEKSGNDVIKELRLYAHRDEDGKWHPGKKWSKSQIELSGQIDAYDPVLKIIYDNKVVGKWGLAYNKDGKKEHHLQLNYYAWMLRLHGIVVNHGNLIYFVRDLEKRDKLEDRFDSRDIVPKEVVILDNEKIEEHINNNLDKHLQYDPLETKGCTEEGRWKRESVYAIINPKTGRAMPNCSKFGTYDEATNVYNWKGYAQKGYKVEFREGADVRCEEYCNYRNYCVYWKEKII